MGNIFSNNNDEDEEFIDLDENNEPIKKIKYTKSKYAEENDHYELPAKTKTRRRRSNLKNKSKANKRY